MGGVCLLFCFLLQPCTSKTLPIHSSAFQSAKGKEGTASSKDGKSHFSGLVAGESSSLQQRQKRLQEHGKERRELLSKGTSQVLGNTVRLGSGGLAVSVFMLDGMTNANVPVKLLVCCSNQLYQRLTSVVNQLLLLSDYFFVPRWDSALTF